LILFIFFIFCLFQKFTPFRRAHTSLYYYRTVLHALCNTNYYYKYTLQCSGRHDVNHLHPTLGKKTNSDVLHLPRISGTNFDVCGVNFGNQFGCQFWGLEKYSDRFFVYRLCSKYLIIWYALCITIFYYVYSALSLLQNIKNVCNYNILRYACLAMVSYFPKAYHSQLCLLVYKVKCFNNMNNR